MVRPSRPTVVFLPGFMQRGRAWAPVADRVAERYPHRLLDFAGSTFGQLLREIEAVAPERAVLAGYSMGGRLALHAALRAPGRFAALVLVGASAGIRSGSALGARRMADESLAAWIERHPIEEVVERWEALPLFAGQPPELVAAQRAGRLSHDPKRLATLLRSVGQGALPPLWDRLERIEAPVLAVAGERDEPYAAAAREMAALLPHGHAKLVPDAGHAAQLERPEAVAALLLEFLDQHLG